MKLTTSRVVAFILTPLLTAGSTAGNAWLARHFPGLPKLSGAQVTAYGIAGGTFAAAAALKWLHGFSLWERAAAAATRIYGPGLTAAPQSPTAAEDVLPVAEPPAALSAPQVSA